MQGPNSRYLIFLNERAYAGIGDPRRGAGEGVRISATPPRLQSDGRGVSGEPIGKMGQTEPGKYKPAAQGAEGKEGIRVQFN